MIKLCFFSYRLFCSFLSGGSTAVAAVVPLHLERNCCCTAPGTVGGTAGGTGAPFLRTGIPPGTPAVAATFYRWNRHFQSKRVPEVVPLAQR